eukprot:PhM_4_TR13974/c1_g3_i1/m.36104
MFHILAVDALQNLIDTATVDGDRCRSRHRACIALQVVKQLVVLLLPRLQRSDLALEAQCDCLARLHKAVQQGEPHVPGLMLVKMLMVAQTQLHAHVEVSGDFRECVHRRIVVRRGNDALTHLKQLRRQGHNKQRHGLRDLVGLLEEERLRVGDAVTLAQMHCCLDIVLKATFVLHQIEVHVVRLVLAQQRDEAVLSAHVVEVDARRRQRIEVPHVLHALQPRCHLTTRIGLGVLAHNCLPALPHIITENHTAEVRELLRVVVVEVCHDLVVIARQVLHDKLRRRGAVNRAKLAGVFDNGAREHKHVIVLSELGELQQRRRQVLEDLCLEHRRAVHVAEQMLQGDLVATLDLVDDDNDAVEAGALRKLLQLAPIELRAVATAHDAHEDVLPRGDLV